jgi:hypothetical protein
MVEVTSEMKKMVADETNKMLAEQKEKQAKIIQDRDEKLKEAGLDKDEDFLVDKLAEVREIANKTAQLTKKEADTSEYAIPQSTSEAADNSAKLSQGSQGFHTSCTTSSIPLRIPHS